MDRPAASHFEVMTRYYEHQGWGRYTTDQEWDHKTYTEMGWKDGSAPLCSDDGHDHATTDTRHG